MNHRNKRPRSGRAGCKMCKPWKAKGMKRNKTVTSRSMKRELAKRQG